MTPAADPHEDEVAAIIDSREIAVWVARGYRYVGPVRIYSGYNLSVLMVGPAAPAKEST